MDVAATLLSQNQILLQLKTINRSLNQQNNLWMKKYANYKSYYDVTMELVSTKERLDALKKIIKPSIQQQSELSILQRREETLTKQKMLLAEYRESPFKELMQPAEDTTEVPHITNPILILQGFSYIKQLRQELDRLSNNYNSLAVLVDELEKKEKLLKALVDMGVDKNILGNNHTLEEEISLTEHALTELETAYSVFNTTLDLYRKKVEDLTAVLTADIKKQFIQGGIVGIVILISIFIAFLMKMVIRKYIRDNERIYTMSKLINFVNITIIIFILLFAYLENVTYLVTVLGFASAGLAIAMKDLFMSVLGWIVIVAGGSIHVGDRIRVVKDGATFIGDVLDISMLRITIHEGITLLTYSEHRRAGRIIFIPNNYIFTTMIANYTHGSMKTVWDGIDVTITFDSNHRKMVQICMDIAKHYAKGYTDITRKQLNLLRDRYSLRNTNVEPKVFTMLESNGIRVSLWYQTNAYAALPLRSTISGEIIDAINREEDITIAYPTTTVHSSNGEKGDGNIPSIQTTPTYQTGASSTHSGELL
ncbi:hypothetical protein CCZ01_00630 [Helicobacter monodelphidis]|nr:hypothetical protein CCZ01_00630 [Helicobacter sp. 15-1451]